MEAIALAFEIGGVAVIAGGFVYAIARAAKTLSAGREAGVAYDEIRGVFGRSILLGLEFLVAADLIRTVTVALTLENLISLGVLVLIRTFLSFSLEVEIDGRWPWRRSEAEERG